MIDPSNQRQTHQHAALSAVDVAAGYPGERLAIDNATFEVQPGESIAVIGPNGAGKSTLFKAIAGLIPFTRGHVSIHGEDCRTSHNMVGYVPQHESIDWSFPVTVFDVVMMGRTRKIGWFRWPGRQDREIIQTILKQLSLDHLAQRQIGQLSGGQKRRVFIARALAQETNVLLLDEPFTGVDASAEGEIMETLDVLHQQGITLLLATHDLGKASKHFDKIMLLKQHIIAFGPAEVVMRPDMLQQAYGGAIGVFEQDGRTLIFADEHGCA